MSGSLSGSPGGVVPALAPLMSWGPVIDGSKAGLLDMPLTLIRNRQWNAGSCERTCFKGLSYLIMHAHSRFACMCLRVC